MNYKLIFIGFGVVGQGLIEILQAKSKQIESKYGCSFTTVGIIDMLKGSLIDEQGIDMAQVLESVKNTGKLSPLTIEKDAIEAIKESNANVVIEASYTDIKTGQPSINYIKAAFESGKHVVTTNKGPLALAYNELTTLAAKNKVSFGFEGTVMSGTPVINLANYGLAGNDLTAISGILNGTTNYILTEMEKGRPYTEVLAKAQELGYAEANPEGDVEGYDAMAKVIILANVLMGAELTVEDVQREGITGISLEDVEVALSENMHWRLIGRINKENGKVTGSVKPEKIGKENPLANIVGANNSLTFSTDLLGDINITGAGAGKIETGYALLTDLLDIHRKHSK